MATFLARPLRLAATRRSPSCFVPVSKATTVNIPSCSSSVVWKSSVATPEAAVPKLEKVPSLPFVGSLWTPYSGIPNNDESNSLSFWPEMRRRYGDFYSFGFPGLGQGLHGTVHIIQDPNEMAKLLRKEGKHPSGMIEFTWILSRYLTAHGMALSGIAKRGPEWKRIRSFLQTDLLSPASAQRYLPAALEAAESISRGAPFYSDRMNEYLNKASFDMFSNIMLGHLPRVCDPTTETDPEDEKFCWEVAQALRILSQSVTSPFNGFLVGALGIETKMSKDFDKHFGAAIGFADKKVHALKEMRNKGQLTPAQVNCYANQAFERQLKDDSLTEAEAESIAGGLLAAGVDTTGGLMSWKLLHIAAHPHVQETLYEEISKTTKNGKLTKESVLPETAPYLHAFMREAHRLGNASPFTMKWFPEAVEVHGVALPPNSAVGLDTLSQQVDPELVEDPNDFRPERFLKEAVQARKGTPSEVIDHAFFSGPFSQGARKCPGSRVANMEASVMIAQLVLDWHMTIPSIKHWSEVPYDLDTVTTAQLPRVEFTPRARNM